MTDEELIARLRKDDTDFWHAEAADRIEALGAKVARLERELDYMAREADMNEEEACAVENDLLKAEAYARELEAKLAKAVEALENVIGEYDLFRKYEYERGLAPLDDEIHNARAALLTEKPHDRP